MRLYLPVIILAAFLVIFTGQDAGASGRFELNPHVAVAGVEGTAPQYFAALEKDLLIVADSGEDDYEDDYEDEYDEDEDYDDPFADEGGDIEPVADPLEGFNRAMFRFNDKLYYWVLKPVASGYSNVVPEPARVGVKRFFTNLTMPIRFVNCVLQFKVKSAGTELFRFVFNTAYGGLGFADPARDDLGIYAAKEDFGQTLGFYGFGPGVFITWPLFGPSSIRGTFGLVGDAALNPLNYALAGETIALYGIKGYDKVNATSLELDLYDDLKKDALDPYTFIRDSYIQHRESKIKE